MNSMSFVRHLGLAALSAFAFNSYAQESTSAPISAPTVKAGPALKFGSGDMQFEYKLGGMILLDHVIFDPDLPHTELTQNSAGRAIRANFQGSLYKDWSFRTQYDFAGDTVNVRDAWLQYDFDDNNFLRAGQQGVELGLLSATSIASLIIMERPLGQRVWGRRFSTGLTYHTQGDKWQASTGIYEMNDESNTKNADRGHQYVLRATTNPLNSDDHLLHLGLLGTTAHYDNAGHPDFSVTPVGTNQTELRIVDTGAMNDAKGFQTYGAELIYGFKNVALLGEYQMVKVQQINGAQDLDFSAHNVDVYYFITGEKLPYKKSNGSVGSLKPSGKGALAAFLRYDSIDLNDGTLDGGEEQDMTAGLSWWPNPLMKFTAQYTKSTTEKAGVSDDPSAVGMRMQVVF